ncbi:MAG: hypothetical protein J1F18_02865 [Lachnospiraceae bacterium]|nr:hypothetical protein [Lachnospiraceae bacterium]
MSFLDKYTPMISKIIIGGEEMLNLYELVKCIETDKTPPLIEECIITPYYINENGRYELYQYEFCVEQENGETFEEYILRITGKRKIEEVPDDIIRIRRICFTQIDVNNPSGILKKIIEYFHFLMNDEEVQSEVIDIFTEFDNKKIFVCIY